MKLSDVDIFNPDNFVRGLHHEMFKVLRHEAPVFWQNEPKGRGFWAVTKYADVAAVSKQHGKFSSAKGAVFIMDPPQGDLEQMQMMMLNMDPPRHTKLRRVISEGFTPRRIALIEPHIREMADTIIDRIAGQGECDFVADVAAELPLLVIAELVGIPLGDRQMVFNWSNQLVGFDDPEYSVDMMETGRAAAAEMYMYANQLALERKENPRDDLTSILMHSEVDGEKLTELEFDLFFLLLAVAGNETTRNAISGGLLALIEHPEERARLAANPALMPTAIEEILRWVSPVMQFRRTAMCDTEINGVKIREGDKVVIYYLSANRDEDVFPDPYRFDVGRTPNEHLAFGLGQHFCLGNNLAKLELRMIFEALLQRLPDIDLTGPVERLRSNFINGIKRMPVRFTPQRERISA